MLCINVMCFILVKKGNYSNMIKYALISCVKGDDHALCVSTHYRVIGELSMMNYFIEVMNTYYYDLLILKSAVEFYIFQKWDQQNH